MLPAKFNRIVSLDSQCFEIFHHFLLVRKVLLPALFYWVERGVGRGLSGAVGAEIQVAVRQSQQEFARPRVVIVCKRRVWIYLQTTTGIVPEVSS